MRLIDGIEHSECCGCGDEFPIDMLEVCEVCDEDLCPDCLDEHETELHKIHCVECRKVLDLDPPCPICNAELCDDCFPAHTKKCTWESELGKQQLQLTQFPLFFAVKQT